MHSDANLPTVGFSAPVRAFEFSATFDSEHGKHSHTINCAASDSSESWSILASYVMHDGSRVQAVKGNSSEEAHDVPHAVLVWEEDLGLLQAKELGLPVIEHGDNTSSEVVLQFDGYVLKRFPGAFLFVDQPKRTLHIVSLQSIRNAARSTGRVSVDLKVTCDNELSFVLRCLKQIL